MSLIPFLFDDPFDYHHRPSRVLNQRFGSGLSYDDLLQPFTIPREVTALIRNPAGYLRPWSTLTGQDDVGSTITCDKEKFQANLDVQQFAPNEISVKATGENQITIEGKHEEKQDEHGYISRQFVRRYVLPKGCDMSKIESKLSSDGVLTITAPRVVENQIEHKEIPVQQTGKPSKAVEDKTKEKKK